MTLLRRDGDLDHNDAVAVLLVSMSAVTIDCHLAPVRARLGRRGHSHTKPGTLRSPSAPRPSRPRTNRAFSRSTWWAGRGANRAGSSASP